jgi:hypothetical protein
VAKVNPVVIEQLITSQVDFFHDADENRYRVRWQLHLHSLQESLKVEAGLGFHDGSHARSSLDAGNLQKQTVSGLGATNLLLLLLLLLNFSEFSASANITKKTFCKNIKFSKYIKF